MLRLKVLEANAVETGIQYSLFSQVGFLNLMEFCEENPQSGAAIAISSRPIYVFQAC
jgi:hypothetical protein